MKGQHDLFFSGKQGQLGKEAALDKHEQGKRIRCLARARVLAEEIAQSRPSRQLTIDAVQHHLAREGYMPADLGLAAGVVFRGKQWCKVGTRRSTRATSHARDVNVWELLFIVHTRTKTGA